MNQITSQLELFNEIIDWEIANAIIYTRKKIIECERDIYKIEKKNLEYQIKICQKLGSELQQSGLSNLKGSLVVL